MPTRSTMDKGTIYNIHLYNLLNTRNNSNNAYSLLLMHILYSPASLESRRNLRPARASVS